MSDSVIIIGGGVIGLLSAWQLSEAGYTVQLLEKSNCGQESSWAGGGIISPLFSWRYPDEVNELARYSQQHYQALCQTLMDNTGIDPEWTASGLLMPNLSLDNNLPAQTWLQHYQYRYDDLSDATALQQLEPAINAAFEQGLYLPDMAQLRNPRLLKALYAQLQQQNNVQIHTQTTVQTILQQKGKVTGVVANQGNFNADTVISCQGAWGGTFDAFQPLAINIKPVRGQMLLFKAQPKTLKHMILLDDGYLIPRRDGRIVCGSTLEFVGFDKQTTAEAQQQLSDVAYHILPALRDYPLEHHWAGLRPGSPNGLPYIGEHPDIQGLYLNAGHYRNGIVTGLAAVTLLVDHLLQRPSFMSLDAFALQLERLSSEEYAD
jgi:glycine oxidase